MTGVNAVGLSTFSCYVLFYFAMSSNRTRIGFKILVLVSLLTAIVLLCQSRGKDDVFWSAIFACSSSLVACASPLASLKRVLRTKSCESLPFFYIMFTFLNCVFWCWYGLLAHNNFIVIPNAIGTVIAGLQLTLFLIFPASRPGVHFKSVRTPFPPSTQSLFFATQTLHLLLEPQTEVKRD